MALYAYRCRHCGAESEQFRPIEQRDYARCEACDRLSARRVLTPPNLSGETVART